MSDFEADRLPQETDKQYLAFSIYRDMGPGRTYDRTYVVYSHRLDMASTGVLRPSSTFNGWIKKNNWDYRAKQYDIAQEEIRRNQAANEDAETFLEAVNAQKKQLEAISKQLQKNNINAVYTTGKQIEALRKRAENNDKLSRQDQLDLINWRRIDRDTATIAKDASEMIERALNINLVLADLQSN